MTAANHVITGALIAVSVQQPAAAIPLAFVSHFLIDALPHYGYGNIAFEHRDQQSNFLKKQFTDAFFTLALAFSVPYILSSHQSPAVISWCMFAAYFPDMIWGYQFAKAQRQGHYKNRDWFSRFHKWVQWCERPWGIYIEVGWFALMILLIKLAIS